MNIYLGLDLGTTVLKVVAINDEGDVLASTSKELTISSPKPDWAEEDPYTWWDTFVYLLRSIGNTIDMSKVKGIGLSGQMHGLVAYDTDNDIVRPAIIWADKRSSKEVDDIIAQFGKEKIYEITGNPVFTGFLLPSLLWVKRNEPHNYKRITKVTSPKDYITFKLTSVLRSEPTDALATAAFDNNTNTWSRKLIDGVGIDYTIFPEIQSTQTPYGGTTKEIEELTNIPTGTPVFGGSDQSMSAMGTGLIQEGHASIAVSTGGQCLLIAPKGFRDTKRRLHTLNHAIDNVCLYMAATLSAGLSLKWYKSQVINELDPSYDTFVAGIEKIPLGSEGLFYLPFLAGERTPYFNPNLRGAFIGLSLNHNRLHLASAIMEGVSFSIRQCIDVFKEMHLPIKEITLGGGGTKNPTWRKIITNIINMPTHLISIEDHSPYGAAIYAKFAQEGFDKLPQFYKKVIQITDKVRPMKQRVNQYEALYAEYRKFAEFLNSQY